MAVITSPILGIIIAANVQTIRTMIVLVIVNTIASNFNSIANLVQDAAIFIYSTSNNNRILIAMLRIIISINTLISNNIASFSQWQSLVRKKSIQLIDTVLTRIEHKLLNKIENRLSVLGS